MPSKPIALYGGAFDPPTLAHQQLARKLLSCGFDEVILMPSQDSTFGKKLSPLFHRLSMCHLLNESHITTSTLDAIHNPHGRTIEALPHYIEQLGHHNFSIVIGSDNANAIDRWYQGRELIQQASFFVFERPGFPLSEAGSWCLKDPHHFEPCSISISSTQVRQAYKEDNIELIKTLLDPKVFNYILLNEDLYS